MLLEIVGLVFSIVIGTIGHFVYVWSGKNKLLGFFFATNESVWQHVKLGITPILMWTIVEFLTFNFNNLFFSKFVSIISFVITLLSLYYLYKLISKKNILVLDIIIFYISLAISYYVSIKLIFLFNYNLVFEIIGISGIIFILYLYKILNRY